MFRPLMLAALLLTTAVAAPAQTTGGPPIAYVKRLSNGDEIYLTNSNGQGQVRIYKAPSKTTIIHLDLRPGGNEIAWIENHAALKVLAFDDYGRQSSEGVRVVRRVSSPCSLTSPDYHPSDGRLIFVEGCSSARDVRVVQTGAPQPDEDPLFSGANIGRVRWSRLGLHIYTVEAAAADPGGTLRLRRRTGDFIQYDEFGPVEDWRTFNVMKSGERLVFGAYGSNRIFDFATMTSVNQSVPLGCTRVEPHFGALDAEMVYQTPHVAKGDYVMLGKGDCSSNSNALTGKGTYGYWMDWRD